MAADADAKLVREALVEATWFGSGPSPRPAATAALDRLVALCEEAEQRAIPPHWADIFNRYEAAEAEVARLRDVCPLCGHEWKRHDPEDGKCDAGPGCLCGRDPAFHRVRNAALSTAALNPDIARAALGQGAGDG